MADPDQLQLIKAGVSVWNKWRYSNQEVKVDLSEANLSNLQLRKASLYGANLNKADLSETNLRESNLYEADLWGANLSKADVTHANLSKVDLSYANLREANMKGAQLHEANLSDADLFEANLSKADLSKANLKCANLQSAVLIRSNLQEAILTGSKIFGISAWDLIGEPIEQSNLIITPHKKAEITVDDLQVAQFIYLLLNNRNVRNVINTITSKVVVIPGRFTRERKAILDALRYELRKHNYLPIVFDFEGPRNRDLSETISILAHMAKFVIADITDAKSIPQELQLIIPNLPSLPVLPILLESQFEYGMFEHFKRYPWVLNTYYYKSSEELINSISQHIIGSLEQKFSEINKN